MRITELPRTRQDIYALERACLKEAKTAGFRGSHARTEANRRYFAAIDECERMVREPVTQPSVLTRPGAAIPVAPAPRGMVQSEKSGLYVPKDA